MEWLYYDYYGYGMVILWIWNGYMMDMEVSQNVATPKSIQIIHLCMFYGHLHIFIYFRKPTIDG